MFSQYAKFYNLVYQDKKYKKEADFVYNWAGKPKTILELGGGTGNHARYWIKKADVRCIEMSEEMAYNYPDLAMIGDIRDFNYDTLDKVDACFAMFNVVGYADPIYYLHKLPIKKNGCFIFDCWDSAVVKDYPAYSSDKPLKNGLIRRVVPLLTDYEPYIKLGISIIDKGKILFTEEHIVRSYYRDEIQMLAGHCGYKIEDIKNEPGWVTWVKLVRVR